MKRAPTAAVAAGLLLAACTGDDDGDNGDDGTAEIVATTSAPPAVAPGTTAEPTSPPTADTSAPATEPPPPTGPATSAPATSAPATSAPATTAAPTTAPTTAAPTVPATTVPSVVGDPVVASELVAELAGPVDIAVRPGDDALYVVEQRGRVVRLRDGDAATVADVTDRTDRNGERGLLGLVFSPDGTRAYLDYTLADGGDTVVSEHPVAADGTIDVGSGRTLLRVDQPFGNHNAGDLAFGPDGMLYVTLGDGGSGGDPGRRASDPSQLLGSLLRIDPTPNGDRPYTIPADNPFATGSFAGEDGAPEVWAWGLRNPWKIAFDPVTDELWIPDVGQNEMEEINLAGPEGDIPAGRGLDFGWSAFEGTERFNIDVDPEGTTSPVLTYRHGADNCSISGGVPYRGRAIPELEPAFVYSDYCSGIVWALDLAGGRNLTLLTGFDGVTAVRAGPDGELYVLEAGGSVHRLVPG